MNITVQFHPDAEAEINEAVAFLDLESPGLGHSFLNDLEKAFTGILTYPQSAPVVRGRIRRKTLRKFPYSIMYSLGGSVIRILAICHQKRRPFYWRDRR